LARVLVAAGKAGDARRILGILKKDFGTVRLSTDENFALRDFEDFRPDVLVLAFDTLEEAQHYYLSLYRLGPTPNDRSHRTIILCNQDEVREVIELCKKAYFDDYVLYWPHPQDDRLAMSVWIAGRQALAARGTAALPVAELVAHLRQLHELETIAGRELDAGERQIACVRARLAELEREIIASGQAPDRRLTTDIDALSTWAREFKEEIELALTGLQALTGPVRGLRPLILVVDDDELVQLIISRALLDPLEYEVLSAGNGDQALDQLQRLRPDAILMDVRLPGLDGLSLTRQLKSNPQFAAIPVIMVTSDASRETLESSMQAGAVALLVKPFSREILREKLEECLKK
jgi:CheY-like chemotaxis protein